MNKQLKASFMISLMLITIVSVMFNANAVSDNNKVYVCNSGNPPVANFTIYFDEPDIGYLQFDGTSSYDIDGEIVMYEWEYGDGNKFNGTYGWSDNQYCDCGDFNVTLTVSDDEGLKGNLTKSVEIILVNWGPPEVYIDGPGSGNAGTEYKYSFFIFYPYSIILFLFVKWGDGNDTGWISVFPHERHIDLSHIWSEQGKYTILAKAKTFCFEGWWTEFEIKMHKIKSIQNTLFLQFLEHFPLLQRLFIIFYKFCINRATYSIY